MFCEEEKKTGVKIMIPAAHNMINRYSVSNTVQEVLQQLEGCRKLTLRKKKKPAEKYIKTKSVGERNALES